MFALSHGEDLRCRNEAAWFAFQVTLEEDDDTTRVAQAGNTDQLRQDEVWYWLLLALFGCLAAEGFLGNRTTA